MKNSKFILLLLLILWPLIINAQYSGFDLSRYKLPDIKLSRLDAYFDLGNTVNKSQYKPSDSDSTESRQDNFRGALNFNYNRLLNTERYQGDFNALASGSSDLFKSGDENNNSNSGVNRISFQISSINRFYNQNLNFIEIDPGVSLSMNSSHNESSGTNSYDDSDDQFTTNLSLPMSIGHGRIEPVEDLRLAIYILEELNKAGRINSMPSDNIVLDLAKEISKIKRQRFFDSRIRKIKELQVVDSFLLANNIVTSNDITYFAVLNDQWDYAAGPARTAGFAVDAGIDDQISIKRLHQEFSFQGGAPDITDSKVNSYYVAGFSRIRYDKPVNLYWQTSATLNVAYGLKFNRNPEARDDPAENYRTDIFNANLGYSIQFLPNSRTSARLGLSGNYSNSRGDRTISDPDPVVFQVTGNQLTINTGFDMYYYISPQFRIQLNSNLYYNSLHDLKSYNTQPDITNLTSAFHHDFALTLIYSFF
jgi:hypothetical protein